MTVLILIIGLILFVGLVVVHEFGHFIAARRNGVDVEEFGIGFPPKIWGRKFPSGFLFTINALPLGGFVRLKGENDDASGKGTYGAASLPAKVKIMLAGVGMNLLAAFLLLTFLAVIGMPKIIDNQFTIKSDTKVTNNQVLVGDVESGSPADKAGLKVRDRIQSLAAGQDIRTIVNSEDLPKATQHFAGEAISLKIERNGQQQTLQTTLLTKQVVDASKKSNNPKGYLGVSPSELTIRRSTWSAPIVALGLMKQLTVATFQGLGTALWNVARGHGHAASEQVSGPVGVFVLLRDGSSLGFRYMLIIIAIISLTLAIMNVLPIPALDGGRLFVTLLYRKLLRRPLSKVKEERIHGTGFALLMLLFILITVVDIQRIHR